MRHDCSKSPRVFCPDGTYSTYILHFSAGNMYREIATAVIIVLAVVITVHLLRRSTSAARSGAMSKSRGGAMQVHTKSGSDPAYNQLLREEIPYSPSAETKCPVCGEAGIMFAFTHPYGLSCCSVNPGLPPALIKIMP